MFFFSNINHVKIQEIYTAKHSSITQLLKWSHYYVIVNYNMSMMSPCMFLDTIDLNFYRALCYYQSKPVRKEICVRFAYCLDSPAYLSNISWNRSMYCIIIDIMPESYPEVYFGWKSGAKLITPTAIFSEKQNNKFSNYNQRKLSNIIMKQSCPTMNSWINQRKLSNKC